MLQVNPSFFARRLGALAILSIGCGAAFIAPAAAAEASYRCKDGTRLSATFKGDPMIPGTATLAFADGTVMTLPQALSADGGRYVSGATEFWIKGSGATLTRNGKATTCRSAG